MGDKKMLENLSVYREEKKYYVSYLEAESLKMTFSKLLQEDEYSKKQDGYTIRNVYFDSINNIDFNTKLAGTLERKKIRLRIYDIHDKKAKLEMKKKYGELQHKISVWIEKEEALKLLQGDYYVLKKYFHDSPEALEIYTIMTLGGYKPVCMIEYKRKAYIYPAFNTRITLDTNIRASEVDFSIFKKNPNYNVINNNQAILEVKYNQKLMKFISDVLKPYHLVQESISKYTMSRRIFYDFNY